MPTPQQARAELARRELSKRASVSQPQPEEGGIDFGQVGQAGLKALVSPTPEQVAQSGLDRIGGAGTAALQDLYGQGREALVGKVPQEFKQNIGRGITSVFAPPPVQSVIPEQISEEIGKQGAGVGVDVLSGLGTEGIGPVSKLLSKVFSGASKGTEQSAGRIINQYLKPREAQFAFGKDPGLEVAKQGLKAWNREDLGIKVGTRLSELSNNLENVVGKYEQGGTVKVDMVPAFKKIASQIKELSDLPETTVGMREDLKSFGRDLFSLTGGDPLNVSPAQALKIKRLVGKLPSWAMRDPKMGTKSNIARQVYGSIDEAMDLAMPETADLNSSISNLIGAKTALKTGRAVEQKKSFIGLFDRLGPGGIGAALGFAHGGAPTAVMGGLAGLGATKLASSAFGRTRIAKSLMGASKAAGGVAEIAKAVKGPDIAGILKRLFKDPEASQKLLTKPITPTKLLTRNRMSEVRRQLPGGQSSGPTINVEGSSTIYQPEVLESDLRRMANQYGIPTYGSGPRQRITEIPKTPRSSLPEELLKLIRRRGIK